MKRETVPNAKLSHEMGEERDYLTLQYPKRWVKREIVPNATLSHEVREEGDCT